MTFEKFSAQTSTSSGELLSTHINQISPDSEITSFAELVGVLTYIAAADHPADVMAITERLDENDPEQERTLQALFAQRSFTGNLTRYGQDERMITLFERFAESGKFKLLEIALGTDNAVCSLVQGLAGENGTLPYRGPGQLDRTLDLLNDLGAYGEQGEAFRAAMKPVNAAWALETYALDAKKSGNERPLEILHAIYRKQNGCKPMDRALSTKPQELVSAT